LNTASRAAIDQFRAFQALIRQGDHSAAGEAAETLLSCSLSPIQRALVLQLQGELQQSLGNSEAAERCWRASLELRFSPELALRLQEPNLLLKIQPGGQSRALAARLQSFPLDQQKRALLAELKQQPSLRLLTRQLQRLIPPG
jgi:hypothetical protein